MYWLFSEYDFTSNSGQFYLGYKFVPLIFKIDIVFQSLIPKSRCVWRTSYETIFFKITYVTCGFVQLHIQLYAKPQGW